MEKHDAVLIVRDRDGATTDAVLPDLTASTFQAVLRPIVAKDAVVVSDGCHAYGLFAKAADIVDFVLVARHGERTEYEDSEERSTDWRLYRVHLFVQEHAGRRSESFLSGYPRLPGEMPRLFDVPSTTAQLCKYRHVLPLPSAPEPNAIPSISDMLGHG